MTDTQEVWLSVGQIAKLENVRVDRRTVYGWINTHPTFPSGRRAKSIASRRLRNGERADTVLYPKSKVISWLAKNGLPNREAQETMIAHLEARRAEKEEREWLSEPA